MADISRKLASFALELEKALDVTLTPSTLAGEISRPPDLLAAMRYAVFNGGKRIRPFILLTVAEISGGDREQAITAGVALELIHCYSLVHDDLPAMDNDDYRRGKPATHKAFGEATAILAGNGLMALAFAIINSSLIANKAEISCLLAAAAGIGGIAGGQDMDIKAANHRDKTDQNLIDSQILIDSMKTGALFQFACIAGAITASNYNYIDVWQLFGHKFGLLFQKSDDLIDQHWRDDKQKNHLDTLSNECMLLLAKIKKDTSVLAEIVNFVVKRAQ